jgi:DNA primase catalytic subunit
MSYLNKNLKINSLKIQLDIEIESTRSTQQKLDEELEKNLNKLLQEVASLRENKQLCDIQIRESALAKVQRHPEISEVSQVPESILVVKRKLIRNSTINARQQYRIQEAKSGQ